MRLASIALFITQIALPMVACYAQPTAKLHVLSVGVDSAHKDGQLGYYADDAEAIAYILQQADPAHYGPGGARIILRGLDATYDNVITKLQLLQSTARPGDTSVVFFSCHSRENASKDDLNMYLAAQSGVKGFLEGKELLAQTAKVSGKCIVIMDTCRGGAIEKQWDPVKHAAISLLLATGVDEDSVGDTPVGNLRHGYFVNALREGLLGLADDDALNAEMGGTIDLQELGVYASRRATEIFCRQHAVSFPMTLPEIPLVKFKAADKALAVESQQHQFFSCRNPWGELDVQNAGEYLVRTLAAKTKFPVPAEDDNAAAWPSTVSEESSENLEGAGWRGRWKQEGQQNWVEGRTEIRIIEPTMFIRFDDGTNAYLFEVQFLGTEALGGRYANVRRSQDDNGRWVGRFVDYDRIDGYFNAGGTVKGRWDFRRNFKK